MTKIVVVVGAQYGSEAKGHVTAQLVNKYRKGGAVANVRVAGPNAGHTVIDEQGQSFALRQVPVGSVYGGVPCVIAPGSEVDPTVLLREVDELQAVGHLRNGLAVDGEATVLEPHHVTEETGMHEAIGSTGKGVGAARSERIMRRKAHRVKDDTWLIQELNKREVRVDDTVRMIKSAGHLSHVVIEGTQGYGLGLHAGHYPQCTSSDCRAIDFLSMAGLSPWDIRFDGIEVWCVARVYPIRVAGNSGPLKDETTWDELGLPEERTTVTKKVRRVGGWDADLLAEAVGANGGFRSVRVALTMLDQKFPEVQGSTSYDPRMPGLAEVTQFIKQVEVDGGAPVKMLTTSPRTAVWL